MPFGDSINATKSFLKVFTINEYDQDLNIIESQIPFTSFSLFQNMMKKGKDPKFPSA